MKTNKDGINKMKENIQTVLKKVREEFETNKKETATAIESLQKVMRAGASGDAE